jgi:hypothetical protein
MFLNSLKPPRSFVKVVLRRPVKIGPDGKVPEMTAQQRAYVADEARKARKLFRRKQIIYWSIVAASALAVLALWVLAARFFFPASIHF